VHDVNILGNVPLDTGKGNEKIKSGNESFISRIYLAKGSGASLIIDFDVLVVLNPPFFSHTIFYIPSIFKDPFLIVFFFFRTCVAQFATSVLALDTRANFVLSTSVINAKSVDTRRGNEKMKS
jgi:hypothetical protein